MNGMIDLDTKFAKEIGFTSDKFGGYLWKTNNHITLCFIVSRQEGKGNLSSLFNLIWQKGYKIEVPTPLPRMLAIIKAKGFKQKFEYDEEMQDTVEIWSK